MPLSGPISAGKRLAGPLPKAHELCSVTSACQIGLSKGVGSETGRVESERDDEDKGLIGFGSCMIFG